MKLYGRIIKSGEEETFSQHDKYLHGLKSCRARMQTDIGVEEAIGVSWRQSSEKSQTISLHDFPPGSVLVIR